MSAEARERARNVRLMIFDVDGVMTDGKLYYTSSGEEMKAFHTLDGQGVKMLMESGVEVALLTARQSKIVERRAAELGITRLRQGASHKLAGFQDLMREAGVNAESTGYAGDDLVDLVVLLQCGFSATVPEAPQSVSSRVHYVCNRGGGQGAVRELCEFILECQGTLEAAVSRFLR